MAKNVVIRNVEYDSVPAVDIPQKSGGIATFYDTSDADFSGADMRSGKSGYGPSGKIDGAMSEKSAQTYTPGTSDQTIAAGQYLAGAQTIKGDPNLRASNIIAGARIFNVDGSVQVPVISQDSTTKVLSIS